MSHGFHEPLEIRYWLVNTFSGSIEIFTFLAFIFISGMAAKFRMNGTVTMVSMVLFGTLLAQYFTGIYIFMLIIVGMITFISISRVVKS
jgi:hypothetical protein